MWNWKPEKRILEDLFAAGEVVVAGRDGFQRLYDLPERVIPREQLDAPAPLGGGVPARLRAARGAGPRRADRVGDRRALPLPGRRQGDAAGRRRARGEGLVRRVAVDDGGPPVVVPADAEIDGAAPAGGVLLCPFDNLRLGPRRSSSASSASRHVIEVYKPAPQRVYGYYVLPLPVRRPARRAGRPQVRPRRGRAARAARSTSSRRCGARARSRPRSTRRSTGSRACSASSASSGERRSRGLARGGPADRRPGPAPRRLGAAASSTRCAASVSSRSTRSRRSRRPQYLVLWSRLGPVRPRRARPPALGGAEARRVGRVPLPDRGPAAPEGADAAPRPAARPAADRIPEGERRRSAATCCASSSGAGRCSPARSRTTRPTEREAHRWWGERKMGLMLGVLNARGEVAVVGRRGKQRVWDLAERWYPETETRAVAGGRDASSRSGASARSASSSSKGRLASRIPMPTTARCRTGRTFLSPFDRLVHDRDRAEALWGFRYRLEMYVPAAKREYGYYVLPILRGDRIVGRIEPVHDRRRAALHVRGVWWEDGVRPAAARRSRCGASRAGSELRIDLDGLRDPRDPRGPGARPGDRRGHRADLPDLHLRRRRRSASTRATTTRAPRTRRAARSRPASPRWRAPSTASRSRPAWARRRR